MKKQTYKKNKRTKKQKAYKMNKKEIKNKINACLLNGMHKQVAILEKALEVFDLAPFYGESGLCEKVIETVRRTK